MKQVKIRKERTIPVVIAALTLLMLAFGIGAAGLGAHATDNRVVTTKIAHISDSHVLPMSYCNEASEAFQAATGLSKLMAPSEAALETALAEMYAMEDAPTIILLSGDITSNGEYEANRRVAEILTNFTAKMRTRQGYEKFQIFIVPGNHDMYNDGAVSYMPTEEELAACASDEERLDLMRNYKARSVATTTSKDIFELYSDFGYCNCPGRKSGHHLDTCGIAEGTKLTFFYESEFWYDDETTRTTEGGVTTYENFDVKPATKTAMSKFKENGKDFEYLAESGRIGLCSYVATLDGVTVVSVDGNAREDTGKTDTAALASASGWNETTGGLTTRAQLRWIVDETKEEVAAGNLMLLNCHFNNMPHFDAQDEVISLFVLDNEELYTSTLAKAGIRYSFSGHQHAMDVKNVVTQDGYVMYDIETGSLISYGAGYRTVRFTQEWKDGDYSEDVKTTVHSLVGNNGENVFSYGAYKLTSALEEGDVASTQNAAAPTIFPADDVDLYGDGFVTLVTKTVKDNNGDPCSFGDNLTLGLHRLITMNGLLGNFVNDGLFDRILGALSGMKPDFKFTYDLLCDIVDDLPTLDMPKLTVAADGKSFTVAETATAGYGIVDYAIDLLTYLMEYDFSYGRIAGGVTLADLMVEIYGGHLTGAHTTEYSAIFLPLKEKLENGEFVDFLISTLVDGIVPVLERLFTVPIRFDTETALLAAGTGLDISSTYGKGYGKLETIDKMVRGVITGDGLFVTLDEDGYYSLRALLKDLLDVVDSLLENLIIKSLVEGLGDISKYVALGKKIIGEYTAEGGTIRSVLEKELLDKYVTDAFCRNLGKYAAYLVGSVNVDDTPDGSYWGEGNRYVKYTVVNTPDFNVTTTESNATEAFGGKAYARKKGTDGTLEVVPSAENGLLASMISVSIGSDVSTTKNIRWTTSIDPDVFDKNADGDYEYGATVPKSYIRYSTDKKMKDATTVEATSFNRDVELPTIDLGIMYFNMSHRYRLYNVHDVALTGLKAGKTYYYQLGSDEYGWTETYKFTTADDGKFRFMAMTDIQGSIEANYTDSADVLASAASRFGKSDIAFIASMGDNVDNGKSILQYTWWLDDQRDVWANNTLVTMAGNHEKKNASLSNAIAIPDHAVVSETGYYYSYDQGYAHFVVLDTNDIVGNALSETQIAWLTSDLDANAENGKTKWLIVMLHKGPYTAGSHAFDDDVIGLRAQLTPIFADYGVDLVLQGHDHTYSVSEFIDAEGNAVEAERNDSGEITNAGGVLYVNMGTMGDKYYNYLYSDAVRIAKAGKKDKALEKYVTEDGYLELTETPCYADIEVSKNTLKIRTYTQVDGKWVEVDDIVFRAGGLSPKDTIITAVCVSVGGAVIIVLAVVLALIKKGKIVVPKRVR